MNTFELVLDSRYRDKKNYPRNADFVSVMNPQPSPTNANQIYFEKTVVGNSFRWYEQSQIEGQIQDITGTNGFQLESDHFVNITNYYTGLLFTFVVTGESCTIFAYNPTNNLVLLDTAPSSTTLQQLVLPLTTSTPKRRNYTITNKTGSTDLPTFSVFPLGLNIFFTASASTAVNSIYLQTGPASQLYVQNVSKNWVLPITSYVGEYRLIDLGVASGSKPFEPNNIYQIRYSDIMNTFMIQENSRVGCLVASTIVNDIISNNGNLHIGTLLQLDNDYGGAPILYRVVDILPLAQNQSKVSIEICDVGNGYPNQTFSNYNLKIVPVFPNTAYELSDITVDVSTSVGFLVLPFVYTSSLLGFLSNLSYSGTESTIMPKVVQRVEVYYPFFGSGSNQFLQIYEKSVFLYYSFVPCASTGLIFVYCTTVLFIIPDALVKEKSWVEFIPQKTITCGINIPLRSFSNPVCFEIRLVSLIIPNKPVAGYKTLPSFFPFFMIELYQNQGIYSNRQVMYTNNPNATKAIFYCPNGNPLNPTTSSYVIIRSWQRNVMKWVPTEDVTFRVLLPNGETLQYDFENNALLNFITEANPLDVKKQEENISRFTRDNITATFQFTMVSK